MIATAALIAAAAAGLGLGLNLWRLIRGPGAADRILALDTMTVNAIALVLLLGLAYGTKLYFEAALLFAMVGFLTTVAFCRYLLRGNIIE
ncbi:K+/H+ antiporter subunit F [Prosthecodimorpha staleyi]|uniref:K+/H+ antiporter subunit F n=1 Tax=Prosthecodimorpha staleyi TaxID=2840188 RepID=A0A947D0V4_9HYPH|nr:K+/H+ antiporter subunit F [Prosthecodimorpha staleyi]MBT9288541.1 K+/H+ antiporter subunit F [Prosthecodimorpha staleyi]